MALTLTPLADLDIEEVAQTQAVITEAVQEDNPDFDLRFGPFHSLLSYYHALLRTQQQALIDAYLDARSLSILAADPTADPALVDAAASNYRLTRKIGVAATGMASVVISDTTTVVIAAGATLTGSGRTFVTTQAWVAKSVPEQIISSNDILMTQRPDGSYVFAFPVTDSAAGVAGNIRRNTSLTLTSPPTNYVSAYASTDFDGGTDTETNQDLLARLPAGLAAPGLSNRGNMESFLRAGEVGTFIASSVVSLGDPEMQRGHHGLWPVSSGGKVDWYARSQELINTKMLTVEAVLIEIALDGYGIWQLSLVKDDFPGFYEITGVTPTDNDMVGSLPIIQETRSLDLTGDGFIPDLATTLEGVYSRFQTAVVQFKDTLVPISTQVIGAVKDYNVTVTGLPGVAELQDAMSADTLQDLLIKAPVPCFVSLNFTITRTNTNTTVDTDAIKNALATAINTVGFTGVLPAAPLLSVIQSFLTNASAGPLDMLGRLRYPSADEVLLRSADALVIPNDYVDMVTARTVQFFTSPAAITIALV